jgi:hypothetical protein
VRDTMRFVRVFLQCIGALTLVLAVAVALYVLPKLSGPSKSTDKDDAIFVLNWAGLNTKQHWTVIDGAVSERNITGDHADYYCIQLEDISVSSASLMDWRNGPEENELLSSALDQALDWAKHQGATCLPSYDLANSKQTMILFTSMTTHGRNPAGAKILLLQPSTKRLFYVSFDT